MSAHTQIILVIIISALGVGYLVWWHFHERFILRTWASAKRFELLQFKRCFRSGGFSFWETSTKQIVFSIRVRDDSGQERSGWVRFGRQISDGRYLKHEPDVIWSESKNAA